MGIEIAFGLFYISNKLQAAKAYKLVREALKTGKLKKADKCQRCGRIGHVVGHHEDYNEPLEITWVCGRCHNEIHKEWYRGNVLIDNMRPELDLPLNCLK